MALVLALIAGLSYIYSSGIDRHDARLQTDAGMFTVLAKDAAAGGYQMFLKLDTIEGDSDDVKHPREIAVDSFAFSESRAASAKQPTMDVFRVTMPLSSASAKLFLYSAAGTRMPHVILSVRTTGSQQDFLKWILTDARILSYQTVGNTRGDGITDQLTFGYARLDTEVHQILPNGSLGQAMQAGYDQRTGKTN